MWLALLRQARADLRSRKMQAAQLFAILMAGAVTLTLTHLTQRAPDLIWDRIFAATNGSHVTILGRDSRVDLSRMRQMDGVTETAGPFPAVRDLTLLQDPLKLPLTLTAAGEALPPVGKPALTQGRWLSGSGEIVLEALYARELNAGVGERIDVLGPGGRVSLQIAGLFLGSSSTFPQSPTVAGYVLESSLTAVEPDRTKWVYALDVRLWEGQKSSGFIASVLQRYEPGEIVGARDWQDTFDFVRFFNNIAGVGLHAFSLFALAAVGIIVSSSASAIAVARVRDIGLLKAVGFTPGMVVGLLVAEQLVVGLVACSIGIGVGLILSPLIFPSPYLRQAAELLPTGWAFTGDPALSIGVLVLLEAVAGASTALATWPHVREATVVALGSGGSGVWPVAFGLSRLAQRLKMPLTVVIGVRNAFSQPWRAPLTIIGLVLTIGSMTVSLSAESALRSFVENPGLVGEPDANLVVLSGVMPDAEVQRVVFGQPEVQSAFRHYMVDGQSVERGVTVSVRGIGPNASDLGFLMLEGREARSSGEAVVAQGLLDTLGLRVGDSLPLLVQGRPLALTIVGRHYNSWNRGVVATVTSETLHTQLGDAVVPAGYYVRLVAGSDGQAVKAAILRDSQGRLGVRLWETPEPNRLMKATFFAVSGALLLIGLITLFNSTWLLVEERTRDLGVLKAIGFTPAQIVASVVAGVSIQSFAAAVGGLLLGFFLTEALYTFAMSQLGGGGGGPAAVNWLWVILMVFVGVEAVVIASGAVPALRAARIHVAGVLQHE